MAEKKIGYLVVDAFASYAFSGNPAGVVLEGNGLTDDQMQNIAREINASETVFLTGGATNLFKARYFTPAQEVDFCGHATVALCSALVHDGRVALEAGSATITLAVKAGDIPVVLTPHPDLGVEVTMVQPKPRFADFGYRIELLAGALGLDSYHIPPSRPLRMAYTGLWALVVPVATREAIDSARPDFAALADLNQRIGCASTHLYTFTGSNKIYCRDFSPAVGVPEDPVTGSAMGATAALLVQENALHLSPPTTRIEAEQGHAMGRPGQVVIEVDHDETGPLLVRVAGTAVLVLEGTIRLA